MPSSVVRTFTDPVEYFTGIRNLQIAGLVQRRGEFRAKSTRIDLHRLWMHRFDEDLPRIMKVTPSGMRAVVIFATQADQPAMQVDGIEISQNQIVTFGLDWEWYDLIVVPIRAKVRAQYFCNDHRLYRIDPVLRLRGIR